MEVMKHVLGVLQGMGVAITEESKFRLRCVRPLRRDSGASDMTRSSEESVSSVSSFDYDKPIQCFAGGDAIYRVVLRHHGSLHPRKSCHSVSGTPLVGRRERCHVSCCADQIILTSFRLSISNIRISYTAIKARTLEARSASALS